MTDKPKDKSKESVALTLAACGLQTDPSSRSISASLIADNLAAGAKGAAAITSGARGISDSVGSCVANYYDDKKPTTWEKLSKLTETFGEAVTSLRANAGASMEQGIKTAAPAVVDGVTAGTVTTISERKNVIERAAGEKGLGI